MKRSNDSSPGRTPNTSPARDNQYLVTTLLNDTVKCLVCQTSNKTFNIKRHYTLKHAQRYDDIVGDARIELIEKLKAEITRASTQEEPECSSESCILASYFAAFKIAQTGRPFTDGDFVKEVMLSVVEVAYPAATFVMETIPIHRRVNEMGLDLKEQLKDKMSCSVHCSIALDESTDISDTAQLAVYIRLVYSDATLQSLLRIQSAKTISPNVYKLAKAKLCQRSH